MNLFELVIYQSCNYRCPDCPMAEWTYGPDDRFGDGRRKNALTNGLLLEWMDKYIGPEGWLVEITGGEPGLYPEIKTLVPALAGRGYRGLVRTNGSLEIPESPGIKRVAAWHKGREFPRYWDFILILENPDDGWKAKERHCIENKIPYAVFPYKHFSGDGSQTTTYPPKPNRLFRRMATAFASGALAGCFAGRDTGLSMQNMDAPAPVDVCRLCGNIEAVEYFVYKIPGFKEYCGITKDMERDASFESCVKYPLLDAESNWVAEDGTVVGKLGDGTGT